jgi:hypothetical protein
MHRAACALFCGTDGAGAWNAVLYATEHFWKILGHFSDVDIE